MNRFDHRACRLLPLLLLAACNVTDKNNGSTTISIDENRIEQGADAIANEAAKAGDDAANAIENAGPEIEKSAARHQGTRRPRRRQGRNAGRSTSTLNDRRRRDQQRALRALRAAPALLGASGPNVGEWRSLVAHLLWEQRVAGSNPVSPTRSAR